MPGLLTPNHGLVSILPSDVFTRFCNDLIRAEANRLGVAQRFVDDTIRQTVPDGGIDCRISAPQGNSPRTVDDWIPQGGSGWQYKSGKCPSVNELLKKEFCKPEVVKTIKDGDTYCFLSADPMSAQKTEAIRTAIDNLYRTHGKAPKVCVYNATHLAEWAQENLAILVEYFRSAIVGWQFFDQWASAQRFRNEFFPDPARKDLARQIRDRIQSGDRIIRILGRAGMGKTRTVLEALRSDGFRQRTLYFDDAARLSLDFFWQLRQQTSSGVLVVDECTESEYQRIRSGADGLPGAITVVAIGPLEYEARGNFLLLDGLPIDQLAQVVGSYAPELIYEQRRAIAARCGSSPKLVVYIAEEIAKRRGNIRSWEEVEQSVDVVGFLTTRVFPIDSNDVDTKIMRALSLFTRLGWEDEVAPEGEAVLQFEYFGIGRKDAQFAIQRLVRRGVVSRRGRYLYPTPDVLANYLTRDTIQALGSRMTALFAALPESARRSFAERQRQLGEGPEIQGVGPAVIGDPNFFRTPEDLNEPTRAELVRLLAPAFPKIVLQRLEQVLGTADREELLRLEGRGRREIVWTLEELAWWSDYFDPAARLLLRLAWAENEAIGNNASGIWSQLFHVVLGGTEAPFERRLPILSDVLRHPDPAFRRLGLVGVSSALRTSNISRIGGPPEDTGRLPPQEWKPSTYDEWGGIVRTCLAHLGQLLGDPDNTVRNEAVSALADRGAELINSGFAKEWVSLAGRFCGESFERRKKLLHVVAWRLARERELPDPQKQLRQEDRAELEDLERLLAGSTFSDRLRRVVGSWDYEIKRLGRGDERNVLRDLATEALSEVEELEKELPWLLGGDAHSSFHFGKELGGIDTDQALLSRLIQHWHPDTRDDRFITGYLSGLMERLGGDWLEGKLDTWAEDPEKRLLVARTTWRAICTERSARRLQRFFELGAIPASFLETLTAGFWSRALPPSIIHGLVTASSKDRTPDAVRARLEFLDQYLREHPDTVVSLGPVAEETLTAAIDLRFKGMDSYHWRSLAERILGNRPKDAVKLSISSVRSSPEEPYMIDEEILTFAQNTLAAATPGDRKEIFMDVIGPMLVNGPSMLWKLENRLGGRSLLAEFNPEDVLMWVQGDIEQRLALVACVTPVLGQPLAGLARELLVRWGDRDDVRSALSATFGSGGWSGPESGWLQGKLAQLEDWGRDPDPKVRKWAIGLAQSYRKQIKRARLIEEERGY